MCLPSEMGEGRGALFSTVDGASSPPGRPGSAWGPPFLRKEETPGMDGVCITTLG